MILLRKIIKVNFPSILSASFSDKYTSYRDVQLNKDDIEKSYSKSSGPGGQNVNKTNSKAEIRLNLNKCKWLDEYIVNRMKENCKVTKQGHLILTSQIHREQTQNLEECYRQLQRIIFENSIVPKERRFDIPPETEELKKRRVEGKRIRSQVKKSRQQGKNDKFF